MSSFLLLLHVLFCVGIIALVLLQQGRGADVGAAFGSGSANSMFGSRGPSSFLFKLTILFMALFFITSASLTYFQARSISAANALNLPSAATPAPALPAGAPNAPFIPPAASDNSNSKN